jgi:hypothetical protein
MCQHGIRSGGHVAIRSATAVAAVSEALARHVIIYFQTSLKEKKIYFQTIGTIDNVGYNDYQLNH